MKKSIVLGLAVLAISSIAFGGEGGANGGGGGGICYPNGKCLTLAQAGLRVSTPEEQEKQEFDLKVIKAMRSIESKLSKVGFKAMLKDVWASKGTFVYVSNADAGKFEAFKESYIQILKESNFETKNFQLFAVSTKNTKEENGLTYILPSFSNLDAEGKALILVHELAMRNLGVEHLKDILEFDGVFLDFIKNKADDVKLAESAEKLELLPKKTAELQLLKKILKKKGRISMIEVSEYDTCSRRYCSFVFDRIKVIEFKKYDPRASRMLGEFQFNWEAGSIRGLLDEINMYDDRKEAMEDLQFMRNVCVGVRKVQGVFAIVPKHINPEQPLVIVNCDE